MTRTDHSRRTALADARTTWWKPASLPGVWSRTASLADRDRRAAWHRIEKDGEQDAGAFCALRDWQPRGWECRPRSECATGVQQQRSAGGVSTASGAVIPAPVGGNDEPYPIPWLDKNGSHNQAGDRLEPSSIYHFKGRMVRAAGFVGSGVDGSGNRIPFGTNHRQFVH